MDKQERIKQIEYHLEMMKLRYDTLFTDKHLSKLYNDLEAEKRKLENDQ